MRDEAAVRRAAGELEAAVLAVLQAAGAPLSAGDVRARLTPAPLDEKPPDEKQLDGRPPDDRQGAELAYTTVVTILSRLHAKGVLYRHKDGRSFRYAPVADQPGLAARRMARMLDAEPDREAVLARFVSSLSDADEQLLRKMLGDANG